jgi:hypothetical protein
MEHPELKVIEDAWVKHSIKVEVTDDIKALVRYAIHVGYNQGVKDSIRTIEDFKPGK